jgi:hypothetical protein
MPVEERVGLESDAEARIYGYRLAADSSCRSQAPLESVATFQPERDSLRAALDSLRRQTSVAWVALPNGQFYYRSDCVLAREFPEKVTFVTEQEARATGRKPTAVPGCF